MDEGESDMSVDAKTNGKETTKPVILHTQDATPADPNLPEAVPVAQQPQAETETAPTAQESESSSSINLFDEMKVYKKAQDRYGKLRQIMKTSRDPDGRSLSTEETAEYENLKSEIERINGVFEERFGISDEGLFNKTFGDLTKGEESTVDEMEAHYQLDNLKNELVENAKKYFDEDEKMGDEELGEWFDKAQKHTAKLGKPVKMDKESFLKEFKAGGKLEEDLDNKVGNPEEVTPLGVDDTEPTEPATTTLEPTQPVEQDPEPTTPEPAAVAETPESNTEASDEPETPAAAPAEKKESKFKKAVMVVPRSFDVKPQPGYPADEESGLYLKWNKDHYEQTAADKRILENRKLAAEGKARERSEKPEDWWNEFQYIKWLNGNYVPTKEHLVRDYKDDPKKLNRGERKRVEKWIKQGYELPPSPAVEAEPFEPAVKKIELRHGMARETMDGTIEDISRGLDEGSVFVDLDDGHINELTKRVLSEPLESPDGVRVNIFRTDVTPQFEQNKKEKKTELTFNATVQRDRKVLGLKIPGLKRGLNGRMTLENSSDDKGVPRGVVVVDKKGVEANPKNMLGQGMNEFLTSQLGEGLNERYRRYLKEKLGDKADNIKLTITDEGKLRIDFIAKPKEVIPQQPPATEPAQALEPAPEEEGGSVPPTEAAPEADKKPLPNAPEGVYLYTESTVQGEKQLNYKYYVENNTIYEQQIVENGEPVEDLKPKALNGKFYTEEAVRDRITEYLDKIAKKHPNTETIRIRINPGSEKKAGTAEESEEVSEELPLEEKTTPKAQELEGVTPKKEAEEEDQLSQEVEVPESELAPLTPENESAPDLEPEQDSKSLGVDGEETPTENPLAEWTNDKLVDESKKVLDDVKNKRKKYFRSRRGRFDLDNIDNKKQIRNEYGQSLDDYLILIQEQNRRLGEKYDSIQGFSRDSRYQKSTEDLMAATELLPEVTTITGKDRVVIKYLNALNGRKEIIKEIDSQLRPNMVDSFTHKSTGSDGIEKYWISFTTPEGNYYIATVDEEGYLKVNPIDESKDSEKARELLEGQRENIKSGGTSDETYQVGFKFDIGSDYKVHFSPEDEGDQKETQIGGELSEKPEAPEEQLLQNVEVPEPEPETLTPEEPEINLSEEEKVAFNAVKEYFSKSIKETQNAMNDPSINVTNGDLGIARDQAYLEQLSKRNYTEPFEITLPDGSNEKAASIQDYFKAVIEDNERLIRDSNNDTKVLFECTAYILEAKDILKIISEIKRPAEESKPEQAETETLELDVDTTPEEDEAKPFPEDELIKNESLPVEKTITAEEGLLDKEVAEEQLSHEVELTSEEAEASNAAIGYFRELIEEVEKNELLDRSDKNNHQWIRLKFLEAYVQQAEKGNFFDKFTHNFSSGDEKKLTSISDFFSDLKETTQRNLNIDEEAYKNYKGDSLKRNIEKNKVFNEQLDHILDKISKL